MKKIAITVFFALLLVTAFATKALVVTQKIVNSNDAMKNITITWYITETQCKMKMEFSDGNVNSVTWFIPDRNGNALLTYTEGEVPTGAQKMYFTIPVQAIKTDAALNDSRLTVTRTGETKNISGLNCEKVVIRVGKSSTEMWLTTDFKTNFYTYYPFFQNSTELMGLFEEKLQGVPLQSNTTDVGGKTTASLLLVSVTTIELTAVDFQVPAEYKSAEQLKEKK